MSVTDEERTASFVLHGPCKTCGQSKRDHYQAFAKCRAFESQTLKARMTDLNEIRAGLSNERDASVKVYNDKIAEVQKAIDELQATCPHARVIGVDLQSCYTMSTKFCDDCRKRLH